MSKDSAAEGNIQTFLRIRPSKKPSGYFNIVDEDEEGRSVKGSLQVTLPDNFKSDYVNNSLLKHSFRFNGVIDMSASQEEVFDRVGVAAVQNALDGFNSTIFAYGQTGSGKTFTLTGGPERYADRGLIPRSISYLFNNFRKKTDSQLKSYISYLEIYQGDGYDLLDPSHETKSLEDLPKVRMLEDDHGSFHLKNLSMHLAETEEAALNLLFLGDTNRAIAETPMNMASSRSHCIFTLSLEVRLTGADVVRRSKLHLVDLAGSERVGKSNSSGSVLAEAKYINTSLFFLEMVIVALYEKATKGRSHIPYRNSMMTSVLRDSLGGNCKTIMIATMNPEASHTDESLSTCRFAQRVSLIKNKATINEDLDPAIIIQRLKAEVLSLREEVAFLKEETGEGDVLKPVDLEDLRVKIKEYLDDSSTTRDLVIGKLTLNKIKQSFLIFKSFYTEALGGNSLTRMRNEEGDGNKQIKDLKALLLQRDNEIAILVGMVKNNKTVTPGTEKDRRGGSDSGIISAEKQAQQQRESKLIQRHLFGIAPPEDKTLFDDPSACFEWFRERHELNGAIEENKILLRDKYNEAKLMGERANQSRSTINYLKNSIEAIRRERAIQGTNLSAEVKEETKEEIQEEETYRKAIEKEKEIYRESFEKLRMLKPEIEHIKMLLEKGRATLQQQFDQWYNSLYSRRGVLSNTSSHSTALSSPAASNSQSLITSSFSSTKKESDLRRTSVSGDDAAQSKRSTVSGLSDDVNEDIMAFYQAKEELLKRRAAK